MGRVSLMLTDADSSNGGRLDYLSALDVACNCLNPAIRRFKASN